MRILSFQVLLAGDLPDHPHLAGLPDDRAQRHRDRGRLRAGAGRAAGGRQAEGAAAGGQDSAARLHVHAAPRPPRVAPPLRHQPLRRRAQVRGSLADLSRLRIRPMNSNESVGPRAETQRGIASHMVHTSQVSDGICSAPHHLLDYSLTLD